MTRPAAASSVPTSSSTDSRTTADDADQQQAAAASRQHDAAAVEREELIAAVSDVAGAMSTDDQLHRLARRAHAIAGADYAAVATLEADGTTTTWRAIDGAVSDVWRSTSFPQGSGTAGRVVASNEPVIITGFPDNPAFPANEFPAHFAEGMRTAFGVPLRAAGRPFGAIVVGWRRVVEVPRAAIALVQALGDLAALAITRARLLEAERERAAELAAANAELSRAQEQLEQQATELEMLNEEMAERNVELAARVAELDAVLDQMADGVLIADATGEFVRVNPAVERIYGRPLADVPAALWSEVMRLRSPDGRPLGVDDLPVRRALREERVIEGAEWTAERADGARIRLSGTAAPLREADGRMAGAVLVFRDITERVRLVERAQEATAMKSRFFAQMSHELRTPINAILGYGNLIADGLAGDVPPKALEMIERIRRSGRHLLELVNDVLDISRLEAGKVRIEPTEFDLVELARDTMATVEPRVQEKGLALALEAPESLALCSDPARVRQILLNLASNAVKFTERGSVTITLAPCAAPGTVSSTPGDGARATGGVSLSVRDTGPGIAPSDLKLIFAEFVQVGPARPAKQEGTGLGLTISQRLARLLGGELRVESELGRGSTFTLVLPARPPAESAETALVSPNDGAAAAKGA
ncbi:MAG TPA: ATP-binding protein [Gemmatimonadaceae bacterium]|nr:ATP-binding protein [Gemmatimonadaceae bacterium]